VRLVNVVLMSAIQKGASDIHIEPYEKELRVRYRIDGILYNIMSPPMKFRDAIASRIKIMAKLDIAEKRLPQDGRIKIRFTTRRHKEHRLPRLGAADAVRREDRHASARQGQADARHDEARLRARVAAPSSSGDSRPWGMVLVTGPTGSGKTNTLYSSIAKINTPRPTS
jgi:type IV pilus assembly protein PilB